ncbi:amino acid ABC transporter permease [Desulfofustis limnaeus]|jgi:polar amino acid transport system permease protein|uniref:Amino acid ABC transporter permease n=1 Tax=Desulfofustis limnaeus TaxID=2740163 RepID=A0ABN6M9H1_9BACT|nr:amino acid ABC transporter permease [Desulfofustis limnaeus]MDX9894104.1 amino acid ABC transporter permease [Desulfofustis sp.]BDD89005.1 amino acid ABC transporter permease [Desulfofustis limnaeus]
MSGRPYRFSWLDLVLISGVLSLVGFIVYRLFFVLEYRWNWSVVPTYLVRYDEQSGQWLPNILLEGLFTTIRLSVWGMLIAGILGLFIGIARTTRRLFPRLCSRTFVELIRNTPPLVLIFIFYYFVSDQILPALGIETMVRNLPPAWQGRLALIAAPPALIIPFLSGALTIGLFQSAYITEIVRAGIQAVDAGQWDAARALGFTRSQQLSCVILPQALRIMLPPLANEFINTIKYSSIVAIISIQELTFQGLQVMASTQASIEIWLTITVIYLVLCLTLSLGVHRLEKRLNVYRR